jgi:protein-S-isoprenylcysteine O-methyltransferase Ste14
MSTERKSRAYAAAQSVVFVLFALAVFSNRGPWLIRADGPARIVGTALALAGLLLMIVAIVNLRRVIQIAPSPREGGHLVTSGVYRYFRHPIYTGIVLVAIGLFLRQPTVPVAAAAVVVIAFLAAKVRFEESLLLARYPDYAAYRARSWGLVPWPRLRGPRQLPGA